MRLTAPQWKTELHGARVMYATGIAVFGLTTFPVFALFNTRNIAWFAVGMVITFGVIHAWFYGP
jgi:hypothetical protein